MTKTGLLRQGKGCGAAIIAIVVSVKVISDGMSARDKWFPKQAFLHPAAGLACPESSLLGPGGKRLPGSPRGGEGTAYGDQEHQVL